MLIVLAKTPPALSGLSQQRFSALALPGANGSGGACLLCPGSSDVNLFCYGKGIIDLDAGAPDGNYDFGVTEQELHGSWAAKHDPYDQEGKPVAKKRDKKIYRKLIRIGDADGSNPRETMEVFMRGYLTHAGTDEAHFKNAVHVRLGSAEAALWIDDARILAGSLLDAIDRCEEATNDGAVATLKDDGCKPMSGWINDERVGVRFRERYRERAAEIIIAAINEQRGEKAA